MTGFISFRVDSANAIQVASQWGIIEAIEFKELGAFGFVLSEGSEHFQVTVSNDDPDLAPFSWSIAYRSETALVLEFKAGGAPFNPSILCTVTVERMPTE